LISCFLETVENSGLVLELVQQVLPHLSVLPPAVIAPKGKAMGYNCWKCSIDRTVIERRESLITVELGTFRSQSI